MKRQRQGVPTSTPTLTAAQVAQAEASSDSIIRSLLPLIPTANSGASQFSFTTTAPVNIQQGTVNFSQIFSDTNRLNVYCAIQQDARDEPLATDGNSFPNEGDQRNGRRQLISLNETWVIGPTMVNEARLGGNRIHIVFDPDNTDNPAAFGINNGVSGPIGLPQITVARAFTFGGNSGFPQGRGDTTAVASDALSWVHGNHTIKFGGEERRANTDNFSATPGTFTFPSITAFLADRATGFTTTPSNRTNRSYANALGPFVIGIPRAFFYDKTTPPGAKEPRGAFNGAALANLALAPPPPETTREVLTGAAKGHKTPTVSRGKSRYDAVLRWKDSPADDLAGYAIVIRSSTAPFWEQQTFVGKATEYTLPGLSIDDIVFGVKAIDAEGHESLVAPWIAPPYALKKIETADQEGK
jgi:hypothetical protein